MLLLPNGKRRAHAGVRRMRPRYGHSFYAGCRTSGLDTETGSPACGACRGKGTAQGSSAEADRRLNDCVRRLQPLTDWRPNGMPFLRRDDQGGSAGLQPLQPGSANRAARRDRGSATGDGTRSAPARTGPDQYATRVLRSAGALRIAERCALRRGPDAAVARRPRDCDHPARCFTGLPSYCVGDHSDSVRDGALCRQQDRRPPRTRSIRASGSAGSRSPRQATCWSGRDSTRLWPS